MTTDNSYVILEQLQLTKDLVTVCGSVYTCAGAQLVAEQLYGRGVRSRLHAPRRTEDRIHFTSDPETGRFVVSEPGEYELILELDKPDVEFRPIGAAPVRASEVGFYRLVKRADLEQMSEVPGHADVAPKLFTCVGCGCGFAMLEDGRIQFHKARLMNEWSECLGSRKPPMGPEMAHLFSASSTVAKPRRRLVSARDGHQIPERKLPEGVYNVIHFAQTRRAIEPSRDVCASAAFQGGPIRQLRVSDLEALLAEIPDVAPRYPTIWAYEQACRTIRERDQRIEKALKLVEFLHRNSTRGTVELLQDLQHVLQLRMPRVMPATEADKSDIARAFEACDTDDDATVGDSWSTVARTLRDEALRLAAEVEHLRTLGETLAEDFDAVVVADPDTGEVAPCGTCSALEPPVTKPAVGRTTAGWPRCAQHLVEDELVAAGLKKDVKRCPSCHHLTSSHQEDGCWFTVRDGEPGKALNCPCTFDARSEHHE